MWGDEAVPGGMYLANFWQGDFPWRNCEADGFTGTAPVGSFPPTGSGCSTWPATCGSGPPTGTRQHHPDRCRQALLRARPTPAVPTSRPATTRNQPQFKVPRKVIKGGSFLCADNYCQRYRPAARRPQMIDTGMSHIGIRTILRTS